MTTKPGRHTKYLTPWKASSTSSSNSSQFTPIETPPNGEEPDSQALEDKILNMGDTAEASKSQEGIKTPESGSSKLDKEIEPPKSDSASPKISAKNQDAPPPKAKKVSCKQHKKGKKKPKKSKKAKEVESSSEDSSSNSASSDSSDDSSESSSEEDEAAKKKKKSKAKKAKKLKEKKKAAKKAKEEDTDSDLDTEDESDSSEEEKKKSKKKKKAVKKRKQAKKNKKSEEEDEDDAEDDTVAQQLAQLQALRGLGRTTRTSLGADTLALEGKAAKKTKKKPGKKYVYSCFGMRHCTPLYAAIHYGVPRCLPTYADKVLLQRLQSSICSC